MTPAPVAEMVCPETVPVNATWTLKAAGRLDAWAVAIGVGSRPCGTVNFFRTSEGPLHAARITLSGCIRNGIVMSTIEKVKGSALKRGAHEHLGGVYRR